MKLSLDTGKGRDTMKVLLIGEYSGVHTNLKKGLEKLGVQVLLVSEGDVWKKFDSDIKLYYPEDTKWKKIYNRCMLQFCLEWAKNADIVQFMNPSCLYIINTNLAELAFGLMSRAKASVTVLAGCDHNMSKHYDKLMPYICPTCLKENGGCLLRNDARYQQYEKRFYDRVDCIVSGEWDCFTIYHDYVKKYNAKLTAIIPYPIDCNEMRPKCEKHSKIVVHYPLNRASKGTLATEKAFRKLSKKYGENASFEIKGRMPIKEYLNYLDRIDIIVDGVYGYNCGLGMSCLMAMAKGKAAVGVRENEKEGGVNAWLRESPQISSGEGVEGIVEAVGTLIEDPIKLRRLQKESRQYVRKYHSMVKVSQKYLELYNKLCI